MYKTTKTITALFLIFFVSQNILCDTNYVSKTGAHIPPFGSWANAATNIQAAVDAASSGDIVLVNDGIYYPSSIIFVIKDILVKSVNGAKKTIVNGNNTHRCFGLNSGDTIEGFTITNGYANSNINKHFGGGVLLYHGSTIKNCTISGNSADYGGGIYCFDGGMIQNCTISGNLAEYGGGGVDCFRGGTVQNCTISENSADYGGGVYTIGVVQNSILWNNVNGNNSFSSGSTNLYNCIENWTNLVNGIITNNPQFISTNNFRLQSISPCRNSGTNLTYVFETFDFDDNSRIMGDTVDMGAFEYIEAYKYPPAPPPTINDSEIDFGKISWIPINEIPRAEGFVVQEQFVNTQGIWSTIYIGTNSNLLIQKFSNAYYRVAAHNSIGYSDWSESVFYSNYPINVTSLNAEQLSDGSGYVFIQSKIKDENLDLSDLKVEYSLNNGASWANGDPYLISVIQNNQSPSLNNSLEYQITNILPDDSEVTILWDTKSSQNGGGSLANQRIEQAKIRITPRNAYSQGYAMFSSAFLIDNTTISHAWIAIYNNDATTTSPNVSLKLNAEGNFPLYMRISNGPNFGNSLWQSYRTSKSWELSPGSGIKTVYVQYKNEKGYTASASTSIVLNNIDYSNFEGTNDVTFLMGRSGSLANEAPAHTVNLTTAAMYKTEISNVEFAQFVSEGGYQNNSFWSIEGWAWLSTNNVVCPLYWNTNDTPNYANDSYSDSDNEPVVGISYYEAEAYANWADYELPTEAQWEFFAKGGDERHYPWADDFWYTSTQPTYNLCNWKIGFDGYTENGFTSDGAEYARYVTSYSEGKSHLGHYNLSGNVAEWVKDWYNTYPSIEETDPEGPVAGTERVIRGGSFVHSRDDLTTTRRMHYPPEFRTNWLGMRVAKNDVVPESVTIYYLLFIIYNLLMVRRKFN